MGDIIYLNGKKSLDFTTKSEFIAGKTKPFANDECLFKGERGYRFPWGNLSEKKFMGEDIACIYFGIRWNEVLKEICYRAGMSDSAIYDATMLNLPPVGSSQDVWTDDGELEEYGTFIIDLEGGDGFSEKQLRTDVWDTYIVQMQSVAYEVIKITNAYKYDSAYLVRKMIDPEE